MKPDVHERNKAFFDRFRAALYECDDFSLEQQLQDILAADCQINLGHPLGEMSGPKALYRTVYAPLLVAIPDLERRDYIRLGGTCGDQYWIGCAGFYTGVFERPWLDIPATGHIVTMRYAEFFRIEDERIVEMYALWDIPELMMQADAWPMVPSLGREMLVPGPATQDGIVDSPYDQARAAASLKLVGDMLEGLGKYAEGGVEAMQLERYWHPRMMWYGPSGIGSSRRISGFRNWHQKPFLAGMPNRTTAGDTHIVMFGDADYVGLFGWPALEANISQDGWLGIAPAGQRVTLRSLDFWRTEGGLIRENWVLVDLLDVYRQLGVDVFARMRAFTSGRQSQRSAS